ncbi:molecular chaperone (plasmid) [Haloferax mediterranei ATCC 33500]|uniref:Chaperone protein n=2 Tax=Haloferax mediterranei TaxID=2252 RepID=I3R9M6_HALMT|nr:molecular chaperone TorD family protein [Haloferax mediterranei]AFK20936.1 chaperone protein [Haloferax mediterranei ATCC 33500]AHZ24195.1 molecular chaperone [Haloferax mediterranei ATCC 33500]EMA05274.1 chaperone protein [Haloferax mediterranei ATCC 33500]MDX5989923.1 molecular chaperone TorD family protein [Haloferax mediterranei ATCC 33500]QCQ77115.1 molecular chaperone [Haloferax mediterranei ATCC 33500]
MNTKANSNGDAGSEPPQLERLDPKQIDRETTARAGIYTVMATLLDEPDDSVYARLASGDTDAAVRDLLDSTGLSVEPPDLTVDDDHDTLCARFNDLFTVGYAEYTDRTDGSLDSEGPRISLYETSYRPEAAWNDVNLDLARAYDYFGLEIDQSARDNHDYLPYQLEFAGYLARLEAASSDDAARARLDLHDRHLHVVASGLADRMAQEPGAKLYGELASFIDRFVAADQQALAERFEGGDGG